MYKLIHKNDNFIVIDKKQGVNFHLSDENEGLCEVIRNNEKLNSLFPVHRLDRITSGLLLFARNKDTARELSELFQNRQIEKFYIGLSDKKPKKRQGMIVGDMEKSRRGAWILLRSKLNPARTRFFSKAYGNGLRLYILKPLTGKTHQLRVALKSIGAPVIGDPLYNKAESKKHDRCYLHAYAIRFSFQGEPFNFSTLPDEGENFNDTGFLEALEEFKEPWLLNWPGK